MAFLSSNSLPKLTIFFLLLCSMAMAMAAGAKKATHLHFYMHDTLSGPSPTAIKVVPSGSSPASIVFRDITVIDDPLTEGPNMSSDLKNRGDHRPFEQVKANPSSSFLTHHPNSFPKIKHISTPFLSFLHLLLSIPMFTKTSIYIHTPPIRILFITISPAFKASNSYHCHCHHHPAQWEAVLADPRSWMALNISPVRTTNRWNLG